MSQSSQESYAYDDNWQCIADINANGSVVASYTWGEGIGKLLAGGGEKAMRGKRP
jgi:hypothetical protein